MNKLTQKELKKLLDYDPETGLFVWLIAPAKNVKVGSVAGTKIERGYITIGINKVNYKAHRLVWLYMMGEWPEVIDHIDHVNDNNKWGNIRNTTHQENGKNQKLSKANTSGITGVCWNKAEVKWLAAVKVNNRTINLGHYEDKFEAICARMSANNKYRFHTNHGRLQ